MTTKEFGIFADFKPLTPAGKRWIEKWDPNFVYLGLNDEGLIGRGSSRPRRAWGAKRSTWEKRIASDVKWLEDAGVEACFCIWYDFTRRTNDDLLAWVPDLIERLHVRTVVIDVEKAAKESAARGESDTRFLEYLVDAGCRIEVAGYASPIGRVVSIVENAAPEALMAYLPMAYSHYPPDRPEGHWTRSPSWRPGRAQALAWAKAPSGPAWSETVMGVGCYWLRGWGQLPADSLADMVSGSPSSMVAVWSLKHAVIRGRDWIGETLDRWRSDQL